MVSGIDAASLEVVKGFYDGIFKTTVLVSGPKVAEPAKLIENTFRLVNISMISELATQRRQLALLQMRRIPGHSAGLPHRQHHVPDATASPAMPSRPQGKSTNG